MADEQLLHFSIPCNFCCLHGSCMKGFVSSSCISLCKSSFVEKQVYSFYQRYDAFQTNGIRTIGIATCRIGWSSKTMIGNDRAVWSHIIFSILDSAQFEYGDFVKIYHVTDDVIRCLFFLEQKTASRNSMFQWNGADCY